MLTNLAYKTAFFAGNFSVKQMNASCQELRTGKPGACSSVCQTVPGQLPATAKNTMKTLVVTGDPDCSCCCRVVVVGGGTVAAPVIVVVVSRDFSINREQRAAIGTF